MVVERAKTWVKSHRWAEALARPLLERWRQWRAPARAAAQRRAAEDFRATCRALSTGVDAPYFVKVGAHNGLSGDPVSDILLDGERWRGLLVEPTPYCVDELRRNFADPSRFAIAPTAVAPRAGRREFYYVDRAARHAMPDLPDWFDQLGSLDRDHITRHLGGALEPFVRTIVLDVATLNDILRAHDAPPAIDLLHIDAEGYDFEILKTLDFQQYAPVVIYLEHMHLPNEGKARLRAMLTRRGYAVFDCGLDYFARHRQGWARLSKNA